MCGRCGERGGKERKGWRERGEGYLEEEEEVEMEKDRGGREEMEEERS